MGKSVVLNFNNVRAIHDIEISGSKNSVTVDGKMSERNNEDGKKITSKNNAIREFSVISPDVITITIKLERNCESITIEKHSELRKNLRLVLEEEEEAGERNGGGGDVGKLKKRKERNENIFYDQLKDDKLLGRKQEDEIKRWKKKIKKNNSRGSHNNERNLKKSPERVCDVLKKKDEKSVCCNLVTCNDNEDVQEKTTQVLPEVNVFSSIAQTSDIQKMPGICTDGRKCEGHCPECGGYYTQLLQHYRLFHPQFTREEAVHRTGGSAHHTRPRKFMCPLCHLWFANLPWHVKCTHNLNVSNLEESLLVTHSAVNIQYNSTTTITPTLSDFKKYLVDVKNGAVQQRTVTTYASYIKNILAFYLPPDGTFTNDVCANFNNLDDKNGFFEHAMKTMTPLLVYHYFTSVGKFLDFIHHEKKYWWFDDLNQIHTCRSNVNRLRQIVRVKMQQTYA